MPPEDSALVSTLHDDLDHAFTGEHILIKAHLHRQETLVSLANIPLNRLDDVAELIRERLAQTRQPRLVATAR